MLLLLLTKHSNVCDPSFLFPFELFLVAIPNAALSLFIVLMVISFHTELCAWKDTNLFLVICFSYFQLGAHGLLERGVEF